jgi:uncharacterized protein YndB with AHSA1/START domain
VSDTTVTATPGGHEVIISRGFRATRDRVFEAYTNPELVVQWMGPSAFTMAIDSWETVAGGKWRYVSTDPAGNDFGFHGVYHDVVKDERIVQTFEFEGASGRVSLNVIRFEENEGETTVTSTAVFETVEDRDSIINTGLEDGAHEGYERLASLLDDEHAVPQE